jgi:hypothetical protein
MENNLENTCEKLQNQFDIKEPNLGHFDRFQNRLSSQNQPKKNSKFIYKYLAIAASLALLFGILFTGYQSNKGLELADISPKMEETQGYFSSVIKEELENVMKEKNDSNKVIIDDAFNQLNLLENEYKNLMQELKENNENKTIIYAMISNYQQRITVLQNLLKELENIKQLKNTQHESNTI